VLPADSKRVLLYAVTAALMLSEGVYDLVFANMAYDATGQAHSVATTYAIGYGAEILVTIFGAGFLDYFDKRRVFAFAMFTKIAIFGAAVAIAAVTPMSAPVIWAFAFAIDLIHHYSRLAVFALISALFQRDELGAIHGTNAVLGGATQIAAPLIAALAIAGFGLSYSLSVSVALQVGALGIALALFRMAEYRPSSNEHTGEPLRAQVKSAALSTLRAAREIAGHPGWRGFLGLYTASSLALGVSVLLWVPLLRSFHGVADQTTGWYLSIGAIGMVVAGLAVRNVRGDSPNLGYLAGSLAAAAGGLALSIAHPGATWLAACATVVLFLSVTLFFRTATVVMQANIPEDRLASWYGVVDFTNRIFGLIGVLAAGAVFDIVGPVWLFGAIAAALVIISALWTLRAPSLVPERVLP